MTPLTYCHCSVDPVHGQWAHQPPSKPVFSFSLGCPDPNDYIVTSPLDSFGSHIVKSSRLLIILRNVMLGNLKLSNMYLAVFFVFHGFSVLHNCSVTQNSVVLQQTRVFL